MTLVAAVLAGLAVLVAGGRVTGAGRLARVLGPPRAGHAGGAGASGASGSAGPGPAATGGGRGTVHAPVGRSAGATGRSSPATPRVACAVAGAALALLLAPPAGLVLGLAVALLGPRAMARLEPGSVRADRAQLAADLPLVLDLLAACLAGGAALPEAARVVAPAVPGPAGARLAAVSALLAVGTPAGQAWAALTAPAGASAPPDPLGPAARALGRAADGGAPVAAAVARLAQEARAQSRAEAEQAARRVGVLVVAPLGLCFLPAFVLLGVVPVVIGLAGPLLATF